MFVHYTCGPTNYHLVGTGQQQKVPSGTRYETLTSNRNSSNPPPPPIRTSKQSPERTDHFEGCVMGKGTFRPFSVWAALQPNFRANGLSLYKGSDV